MMNELESVRLRLRLKTGITAMSGLLLKAGADPNAAREDGATPLMNAARLWPPGSGDGAARSRRKRRRAKQKKFGRKPP